jgi:tRNA A-37 threonylcarbamoyl transferase component Bud32
MPSDSDPAHDATLAQATPIDDQTLASHGPSSGSARRLSLPDYELGALIGRGGMGDVVLARDKSIGRHVAIKQLRMEKPTDEAVARFLREARIQARLEHPSIVPVHHLGTDDQGLPYFSMKKLTGKTLQELLASEAPPPRQRILRMFADVCLAVEFAHSRGVVHRDLKPANVMIGDFGEVYVLDWGLARVIDEREADSSSSLAIGADVSSVGGMAQAGAMLGTPGWMAPEQIENASQVGTSADVYALGAILFEILAGETVHPRGQGALTSTLVGVTEGPAQRRPDRNIAPELDAMCTGALATKAAQRPSVKELVERLQGYLDGDRDVERRRELAASFVRRARDAMATGAVERRVDAMQAAGRALALDPESGDAIALVTTLMFEPARKYPAELERELTASEVVIQRRQGRVAMLTFLVVLGFIVLAATNGVTNMPFVIGIASYTFVHAAIVWRITQKVATSREMLVVAASNALLAALLSRTLGSMVIVPAVTCIMALSLTAYPQLIDRKWAVIGMLVASWVVPIALEQLGVLAPTWALDGTTIELTSNVMQIGGNHTTAILVGSNIVTIIVFGLFSSALATSRRNAMRQSEIQAWHLRQLLPTARTATTPAS